MRHAGTPRPRPLAIALVLCAALLLGGIGSTAASGAAGPVAETAKKKKCKKGKKGAAAAKKKCGKKKKGKQPSAPLGPSLPTGEWACLNSGMQTLAGNKYTINRTDPGSYTYNPSNGIVDFVGGSYDWAYGIYYPSAEALEIYSNDPSVLPIGTYGWTCTKLSP